MNSFMRMNKTKKCVRTKNNLVDVRMLHGDVTRIINLNFFQLVVCVSFSTG